MKCFSSVCNSVVKMPCCPVGQIAGRGGVYSFTWLATIPATSSDVTNFVIGGHYCHVDPNSSLDNPNAPVQTPGPSERRNMISGGQFSAGQKGLLQELLRNV